MRKNATSLPIIFGGFLEQLFELSRFWESFPHISCSGTISQRLLGSQDVFRKDWDAACPTEVQPAEARKEHDRGRSPASSP